MVHLHLVQAVYLELAEHLAAVADAERESVFAPEELLEHRLEPVVEEDRTRPAGTGAEHIAVGEAAAGDEPLEILEIHAPGNEIGRSMIRKSLSILL